MSESDAPIDPLLHDMESVLEPDEATDADERGQDDPDEDDDGAGGAPDGPVNPEPIT
ncbi:MAG: hypothetical protein ACM3UO_00435 [Bacillota bacterium]